MGLQTTKPQHIVVIHNTKLYNRTCNGGLGASPQICKPAARIVPPLLPGARGASCWFAGGVCLLLFAPPPQAAQAQPRRG